jgi:hypothetical protein
MIRLTAFVLLFFGTQAFATTILVVTDQAKAVKAREVSALLRATEPFSLMSDLKMKVIQTTAAKLGCEVAAVSSKDLMPVIAHSLSAKESSDLLSRSESRDRESRAKGVGQFDALPASCSQKASPISRLITCETAQANRYLGALAKTEKTQFILVVKTDARYGGSGGTYPVITTSSPATMAVHELMHRLGFADEYGYYTTCEADIYCDSKTGDETSPSGYGSLPGSSFNIAKFNARANYSSNSDVRKWHGRELPWLSMISSSTNLLTNGRLGSTPKARETGLFRSIVCDKASKRIDTWQPTTDSTIMMTLTTTYIPKSYWPTIAKSLATHIAN